jgi:glycosyltransferase involved in cell wall biosynthesis
MNNTQPQDNVTLPTVSIITVCFNAEDSIKATLENILEQSYRPLELVIIDGASADSTCNIIKSMLPLFSENGISVDFISEPDKGIQDAYNKATRRATGDWLIYINSGDRIYSPELFHRVFNCPNVLNSDVVYGNILLVDHRKGDARIRTYKSQLSYDFFMKTTICHQAVIFRRSIFEVYGYYDLSFKIAADYDRLLVFFIKQAKFQYINETVGIFVNDGISSINLQSLYRERMAIIRKRTGSLRLWVVVYHYWLMGKTFMLKMVNKVFR